MLIFPVVRQDFTVRSRKNSVLQQKCVKICSYLPIRHLNDTVFLHNIGMGGRGSFHSKGWDIFICLGMLVREALADLLTLHLSS